MSWVCKFDPRALKELSRLNPQVRKQLITYLEKRISGEEDPRRFGKGLKANMSGLWRYRVGDYRIICRIIDNELVVMVVTVAHRRGVYD